MVVDALVRRMCLEDLITVVFRVGGLYICVFLFFIFLKKKNER